MGFELIHKLTSEPPTTDLPEGFFYVSQDNYCLVNLSQPDLNKRYLYSDSATSCIIVIMKGRSAADEDILVLTHLSRPLRYDYFFNLVGVNFAGPVSIWAQGANPPDAIDSIHNVESLMNWTIRHSTASFEQNSPAEKPSWFIERVTLSVGQGNPRQKRRGDYGIDLATMTVSNKQFDLTLEQRDPTGGVQTLFCVFGMKVWPHVWLWEASKEFPEETVDRLVQAARKENWTQILEMTDQEILKKYSSTPECEADWFVPTLRRSAEFVKNYKPT